MFWKPDRQLTGKSYSKLTENWSLIIFTVCYVWKMCCNCCSLFSSSTCSKTTMKLIMYVWKSHVPLIPTDENRGLAENWWTLWWLPTQTNRWEQQGINGFVRNKGWFGFFRSNTNLPSIDPKRIGFIPNDSIRSSSDKKKERWFCKNKAGLRNCI